MRCARESAGGAAARNDLRRRYSWRSEKRCASTGTLGMEINPTSSRNLTTPGSRSGGDCPHGQLEHHNRLIVDARGTSIGFHATVRIQHCMLWNPERLRRGHESISIRSTPGGCISHAVGGQTSSCVDSNIIMIIMNL